MSGGLIGVPLNTSIAPPEVNCQRCPEGQNLHMQVCGSTKSEKKWRLENLPN